jgi:hypothetical protein
MPAPKSRLCSRSIKSPNFPPIKASNRLVPNPGNDEIEHLRSILRDAHKPKRSLAKKVMRSVKDRLQARFHKQAIVDRLEKPKEKEEEDAA